jgi:hypothetical protein
VVQDTDKVKVGRTSLALENTEVFPVPLGADITNSLGGFAFIFLIEVSSDFQTGGRC